MESSEQKRSGTKQDARLPPPPPPVVPSNVVPELEPEKKNILVPMARPKSKDSKGRRRRGRGSKGQKLELITNHFGVRFNNADSYLFHYSVSISYDDGRPLEDKGISRKILENVQVTYHSDLGAKYFAYDGDKTLFTVGPLPNKKLDFTVVLEDLPSRRNTAGDEINDKSKEFKIEISYHSQISPQAIKSALKGNDTANPQDAIGVLNIILRQIAAKQNCLLVGQSFFHDDEQNFVDIGEGVFGVKGFHSRFRPTQRGLFLNFDTSTMAMVRPGPVLKFHIGIQNETDKFNLDCDQICELVSLQPYTKPLTYSQRATLVQQSSQNPTEKMNWLTEGLEKINYNDDPVLKEFRVVIDSSSCSTEVEGRVLPVPKLKVGNGEDLNPSNVIWNYDDKKFLFPAPKVAECKVVIFSPDGSSGSLVKELIKRGKTKGLTVDSYQIFREESEFMDRSASARAQRMYEIIDALSPHKPQFILCILSERKNSDIYGAWKKKCLVDWGVVTQCIAPTIVDGDYFMNDEQVSNVLLKINVKLGGLNSIVDMEYSAQRPEVMKVPTMIVGMTVSHGGSTGQSIAAIVNSREWSREWPILSKYKATVQTQSPQGGMIDNLFNLFRELLEDFKSSSAGTKPKHIIIFRDGVNEYQFNEVLNIECHQMKQACHDKNDETWKPKFTVILVDKTHHTNFFWTMGQSHQNVPPGTIIDSKICHPTYNDFYLCAHDSMTVGTTRPTHYHVLYDEIGFSIDDLQELVYSLVYVYQISPTAISVVAPVRYAHLAAAQMEKIYEAMMSETGSNHAGTSTSGGAAHAPPMLALHEDIAKTMFFC